jgi:hypothetical protein
MKAAAQKRIVYSEEKKEFCLKKLLFGAFSIFFYSSMLSLFMCRNEVIEIKKKTLMREQKKTLALFL